jgi:hypothetical protein
MYSSAPHKTGKVECNGISYLGQRKLTELNHLRLSARSELVAVLERLVQVLVLNVLGQGERHLPLDLVRRVRPRLHALGLGADAALKVAF